MISVGDEFKKTINKNFRPKCEPKITLSIENDTGEEEKIIEWSAAKIKSMTYKRGTDPVGRTLPYMELTWTEVYKGKLDENGNQMKYTQNMKHAAVDLSFIQNLGFINTWENAKSYTWGNIKKITWAQFKNKVNSETVQLPRMFLESNPSIDGQTITWKAYDLLYFLNYTEVKEFKPRQKPSAVLSNYDIPFVNPLKYLLINARSEFVDSPLLVNAIQETLKNLTEFQNENKLLFKGWIIFEDNFKNSLVNYAATESLYADFNSNGSFKLLNYSPDNTVNQYFSKKLIYKYPVLTKCANVSNLVYKRYHVVEQPGKAYEAPAPRTQTFNGRTIYIYDFDGYGAVSDFYSGKVYSEINRAAGIHTTDLGASSDGFTLKCGSLSVANEDITMKNAINGEIYSEDNPLFCYDSYEDQAKKRFKFITSYFNENTCSLEFETPGNVALEPGDLIEVQTNLYNDKGQISKTANIVSIEITYSGYIKEKIICHEVTV